MKKEEGGPKEFLPGNKTNEEDREAVKYVEKSRSVNRVIVIGVGSAKGFGNYLSKNSV